MHYYILCINGCCQKKKKWPRESHLREMIGAKKHKKLRFALISVTREIISAWENRMLMLADLVGAINKQ